jgi:hypothetical protein
MEAVLITPSPCDRPLHNAALDLDYSPSLVAHNHLCDEEPFPGAQPWTPARACVHRVAEGLAQGPDIGTQPIGTKQDCASQGTCAHLFDQASDQGQVTVFTDLASEPQPGTDHHRQRHPHDATLFLDADLVGLHLPQIARRLD